jgi:hypothetical protein
MLKRMMKGIFAQAGYQNEKPTIRDEKPGFALYKYLKSDGSFDYQKYNRIQIQGNKKKIDKVWVIEKNIAFLSDYIKTAIGTPRFGICHGTRRGKEQEWFRKYLGCEVIGTEISDTAEHFPYTIRWDFHNAKDEWLDAVDFIYSNSLDHSYNPEECLNTWMSCIRKGGLCIIEHSSNHGPSGATELDPFGADIVQMPYLITLWGAGRYGVRQLLNAPARNDDVEYLQFIVIHKF